jgi:hypothetical protein
MFNTFTNINETKHFLFPQIIEKIPRYVPIEFHVLALSRVNGAAGLSR